MGRSGLVCAQPETDQTRSGGQTFNPPPIVGEVGSDRLEHQQVAVEFGRSRDLENKENSARKWWKSVKSFEFSSEIANISTRSGEISPDLAKNSTRSS